MINEIKKKILNDVIEYSKIYFKEKKFIAGVSEVPVSGRVIDSLEISNLVES